MFPKNLHKLFHMICHCAAGLRTLSLRTVIANLPLALTVHFSWSSSRGNHSAPMLRSEHVTEAWPITAFSSPGYSDLDAGMGHQQRSGQWDSILWLYRSLRKMAFLDGTCWGHLATTQGEFIPEQSIRKGKGNHELEKDFWGHYLNRCFLMFFS